MDPELRRLSSENHQLLQSKRRRLYLSYRPIQIPRNGLERVFERLNTFDFFMTGVIQDNHAQSRTLSRLIFGDQSHYDVIDTCILTQIEHNRHLYGQSIALAWHTFARYCNMLRGGYHGDDICLKAACDLFQVTLRAVTDSVSPQAILKEISPFSTNGLIESRKTLTCICARNFINPLVPRAGCEIINFETELRWIRQNVNRPQIILQICSRLFPASPLLPHDQFSRQGRRLTEFGRVAITMLGDGNCLFRCMSYLVYYTQMLHLEIRQMIVAQMGTSPTRYYPLCLLRTGENFAAYLDRMSHEFQWGDNGCIQATADLVGFLSFFFE
uniref:uncharacterized protein LOC122588733 n=1 Tax=Erigeron canadensis TaxID=72917 RepID=UPI001CB8B25F|nr:uncharacterized protein LOC122588733 [Erigeron canadensis]